MLINLDIRTFSKVRKKKTPKIGFPPPFSHDYKYISKIMIFFLYSINKSLIYDQTFRYSEIETEMQRRASNYRKHPSIITKSENKILFYFPAPTLKFNRSETVRQSDIFTKNASFQNTIDICHLVNFSN